jgi:hypothetical protein
MGFQKPHRFNQNFNKDMIDAMILKESREWVLATKKNLSEVKNLPEEKKVHYDILFNLSLYLLQWYAQQVNAGLPGDETGDAIKYFSKENYQASCTRLGDYYTSIGRIANEDLNKKKNKQREADEKTMKTAMTVLKIVELFRKSAVMQA